MKYALTACLLMGLASLHAEDKKTEDKKKTEEKAPAIVVKQEKKTMVQWLKDTKIPNFKIENMTVEDAFTYLKNQHKSLSSVSYYNMLYKCSDDHKKRLISIDMSATPVPTSELLYYICVAAGLNFRIDDHMVVVWEKKSKETMNQY